MEPNRQADEHATQTGIIVVALVALALPLVLAYLLAAWSLTAAAWHLLMAQITG